MAAKSLKHELELHQYLSVKEVAARTTLHIKTVRKRIADKTLKSTKIGGKRVISIKDFLDFVKNSNVEKI